MYSFRLRLATLLKTIKTNTTLKIYHKVHPGYMELNNKTVREKAGFNSITLEKQIHQFAADLRSSKISLVTASNWHYALQKYGESAMAGCLMVGSLPEEDRENYEKFVVDIEGMTDEEIVQAFHYWVKNDKERIKMARLGQEYYMKYRTQGQLVDTIVESYWLYKSGRRGLYFPYGENLTNLNKYATFV